MERRKNTSRNFLGTAKTIWLKFWRAFRRLLHEVKVTFLASFAKWVDPKLEKYRTPDARRFTSTSKNLTPDSENLTLTSKNHTSASEQHTPISKNHTPAKTAEITGVENSSTNHAFYTGEHTPDAQAYTPTTIEEFLAIMKRTPRSVLDRRERHVIATIMNFPNVKVSEIMLPPSAITYVNDDEVLGPLTLDRLYKSGYQHFPVIDERHRIIGLIHTTALNSLEIKQTSHAREILDPKVYYLREDYTLNQALAAFLRTNCYFFLVIDRFERIVGMLTYQMLIDYLLGETPSDKFDRDSDRLAVAKRKV